MCVSPITLRVNNINGLRSIQVPCGKCHECLKRYQNDWMLRMCEEFRNYSDVLFVTLTYNDNSVPVFVDSRTGECFLTVYKKHLQDTFKRFRKNFPEYKGKFKYFITAEYGPRTKRPHYHCLIFGLSLYDFAPFIRDWSCHYGFVDVKPVKFGQQSALNTSRYVSKYCSKGVYENPLVSLGLVDKCFKLVSKHFGESYVSRMKDFHLGHKQHLPFKILDSSGASYYTDKYLDYVIRNRFVSLGGYRYSMPRYYKTKIYGEKNFLSVAIANSLFQMSCDLRDEQIRHVQSNNKSLSFSEACYFVDTSQGRLRERRDRELGIKLAHFYDKSLI